MKKGILRERFTLAMLSIGIIAGFDGIKSNLTNNPEEARVASIVNMASWMTAYVAKPKSFCRE